MALNPQPMGLGLLGNSNLIHKRKFRWTFEINGVGCPFQVPASFVKVAARPSLSIEETEINYLNGKTWIPGKGTWENITVTYYDVANNANDDLWTWLATVYDFTDPVNLRQASARSEYAGEAILQLYDGCGVPVERWFMGDCWPTAVNWQDLDYSNSEECTLELTLRYSQVKYTNLCGGSINPCCAASCSAPVFA